MEVLCLTTSVEFLAGRPASTTSHGNGLSWMFILVCQKTRVTEIIQSINIMNTSLGTCRKYMKQSNICVNKNPRRIRVR